MSTDREGQVRMGTVAETGGPAARLTESDVVDQTVGTGFDLDRSSVVLQVVVHIRDLIVSGRLAPGERLREQPLASAFGISRNTLREAFRVLIVERVLVRESGRGVLVRRPNEQEVRDIYRARRLIEGAAVRAAHELPRSAFGGLRTAVRDGEAAAKRDEWRDVGTADIAFHAALVALAGSRHLDELSSTLSAELRLSFHAVDNRKGLHQPFLKLNRTLFTLLAAGDTAAAETLLDRYLTEAEEQVVAATRSLNA